MLVSALAFIVWILFSLVALLSQDLRHVLKVKSISGWWVAERNRYVLGERLRGILSTPRVQISRNWRWNW